ncbi:MAG: hypothetical protein V2I97_13330, partial [Desulfococcaceae bacterium]|nr:hypothetical protein [Desulfococcaceae bacterium]
YESLSVETHGVRLCGVRLYGVFSCFVVNAIHDRLYESVCEKPASAFIFALRAAFMFRCDRQSWRFI